MGERLEDRMDDRNASTSGSSNGEYFHPLGFREKNWRVSQPRTSALSTTLEKPPAMEIWNPKRIYIPATNSSLRFFSAASYSFWILTAQTLNSGILETGSRASRVSRFAAASLKWKVMKTTPGGRLSETFDLTRTLPRREATSTSPLSR